MDIDPEVTLHDTALHEAVRFGDFEEVKSCLRDGLNPNQIGLYQWSPMHEAAQTGDVNILAQLLKHNGDPNHHDLLKGCTAVHYAAQEGHCECLRLLLEAGGCVNILNNEGQTSLNVAAGECLMMLKQQDGNKFVNSPEKKRPFRNKDVRSENAVNSATIVESPSPLEIFPSRSPTKICEDSSPADIPDHDLEIVSLDSVGSGGSTTSDRSIGRTWGTNNTVGFKHLMLGHIQLSFEYNSKNATLKIRIWQITDLIMPPADASMISSIYAKSYLLPDKRKESKRRTEEISIYKNDGSKFGKSLPHTKDNTAFKSSTFHFDKALEYKNITKEVINEKIVHIEVCIVQKYTRRSFVIGAWNLPLKFAVKKLVKESYPLSPRIGTKLPENMKVYSANQLSIVHGSHSTSSPPTRFPSVSSLHIQERASSDSNLQDVSVHQGRKIPSIEITVPDEEETELQEMLQEILVFEKCEKTVEVSMLNDDSPSDLSNNGNLDLEGPQGVCVQADVHVSQTEPPDREKGTITMDMQEKRHFKKKHSLKKRYSSKLKFSKLDQEKGQQESVLEMLPWSGSPELGKFGNRSPVSMLPMDFEHDTAHIRAPHLHTSTALNHPRLQYANTALSSSDINDNLHTSMKPVQTKGKKGTRRRSHVELNIPEEVALAQMPTSSIGSSARNKSRHSNDSPV